MSRLDRWSRGSSATLGLVVRRSRHVFAPMSSRSMTSRIHYRGHRRFSVFDSSISSLPNLSWRLHCSAFITVTDALAMSCRRQQTRAPTASNRFLVSEKNTKKTKRCTVTARPTEPPVAMLANSSNSGRVASPRISRRFRCDPTRRRIDSRIASIFVTRFALHQPCLRARCTAP